MTDAAAADSAGLVGVWLDRTGAGRAPVVRRVRSLADVPGLLLGPVS